MLCAEKLEIGCGEHHASAFEDSAFAEDIQHGAAHGVVGRIGERISIHAAEKEEESISAVSDFMRIEVSFAEECRNVGFGKAFFPLRVENPGVAGKQPDFLMEKGPEKGEGLVERVAQAFGVMPPPPGMWISRIVSHGEMSGFHSESLRVTVFPGRATPSGDIGVPVTEPSI